MSTTYNVNKLVSGLGHSISLESIHNAHDDPLIDIRMIKIPRIEAHRWREDLTSSKVLVWTVWYI